MKRVSNPLIRGQGTLEYLLLTTLVVGVVLTIFNGPLRSFLASYQSRKTEYTSVVEQRRLGIPIAWFGGNYPNPAGGAPGGSTSGTDPSAGEDPNGLNGPGSGNDPANSQNPNSGNNGDDAKGNPPGSGAGPAGAGTGPNNSLLTPGSSRDSNNNGRRGGRTTSGDDDAAGEDQGSGSGGSRTKIGVGERADGGTAEESSEKETEEQKEARLKANESGETLKQERELFGNSQKRVREGSCGDLDMKVILQIAFVIALFFLLASMLFQKRGGKD